MPIRNTFAHLLSSIVLISLWTVTGVASQPHPNDPRLFSAATPSKTASSKSPQEEPSNPAQSLIPPSFPTDVLWVAKSLNGLPYTLEKNRPTFTLTSSKAAIGFSGCNRFTTTAQWNPEALDIRPFALTRMACSPHIMSMESAYLSALRSANRWSNEDGLLKISGEQGTLIFERALIAY